MLGGPHLCLLSSIVRRGAIPEATDSGCLSVAAFAVCSHECEWKFDHFFDVILSVNFNSIILCVNFTLHKYIVGAK